jgi:hypothetical protein
MPQTIIIDTWPVWGDNGGSKEGLADILMGAATTQTGGVSRRQRLEDCLREAKTVMDTAEREYEETITSVSGAEPTIWILKPSTINKGAGIQIVYLYEQLVDICWSESDIREW